MNTRSPNSRDVEVGRRIRAHRLNNDMSQTELANRLGLTFQQVQKYEKGANRIGAGRLQQIAEALGVPISSFFDPATTHSPSGKGFEFGILDTSESVRLFRAYQQIADAEVRRALVRLAEQLARAPTTG